MFNFFKSSSKNNFVQALGVDIHSHLIPGIDDGSPDMATTLLFLQEFKNLGFEKVITTPHIMADFYPNSSAIIKAGLTNVKNELKLKNIDIELEVAAEYCMDLNFEKLIKENDLLCFGKRKYILVEMSFVASYPNLEVIIFDLLTKGYTPILAHPERYNYFHDNFKNYEYIRNLGCLMQINIPSLLGYYGKKTRNVAIKLIKNGYIDFLGTDLHHDKHLSLIQNGIYDTEINSFIKKANFKNSELL